MAMQAYRRHTNTPEDHPDALGQDNQAALQLLKNPIASKI